MPVARLVEKVLGRTWTLWPASRVGGLSGLCWLFLPLGQFGEGCVRGSSICLWLRLPLVCAGLVVVVVGLGRCYTLQNPSFEEPPGRQEGEAREWAQTLSLLPGGSAHHQHSAWTYCSPGSGERTWGLGKVAQPYLEGEGSLWLPLSGSASASEGWIFPGAEHLAAQSPPEEQRAPLGSCGDNTVGSAFIHIRACPPQDYPHIRMWLQHLTWFLPPQMDTEQRAWLEARSVDLFTREPTPGGTNHRPGELLQARACILDLGL